MKPLTQTWIGINVDNRGRDPELVKHFLRLFTQMTTVSRVKDHVQRSIPFHKSWLTAQFDGLLKGHLVSRGRPFVAFRQHT